MSLIQRHAPSFDTPRECPSCGRTLDSGWTFCGRCGHAVEATAHDPEETVPDEAAPDAADPHGGAPPERPSGGRARTLLLPLAAGTLAVGLAVTAAVGWAKFQAADEELSVTRSTLRVTNGELVETSSALEDTERLLSSAQDDLEISAADLKRVRSELKRTAGSLTNAQDRMDLQANQIATLRTCLDGVSNALSYAAYDQFGQAVAELNAVEVACDKAYDVL